MKVTKKSLEDMSYSEIFREIVKRQITALMFHDQMIDLYSFLNLDGFRVWHKNQYIEESKSFLKTKKYFMDTHNKLLLIDEAGQLKNQIPESWYSYTKLDVDAQSIKQYVDTSLTMYKMWEEETKEIFEEYAKALLDMGNVCDYVYVQSLIEDVTSELICIYKWIGSFRAVDCDMSYIMDLQNKLGKREK